MSARKFLKHHQEDVRKKIQVIELVSRLQDHVNGIVELSTSQIQAAKILLDKTVSNAPQILAGDEENPLTVINKVERVIVNS